MTLPTGKVGLKGEEEHKIPPNINLLLNLHNSIEN